MVDTIDRNGQKTLYTYDSAGNRTLSEKREGGQVTESLKEEYNALSQVVTAKKLDK